MSLTKWILECHPFFLKSRKHLLNTISRARPQSLDELVISARLPVRTVLLILDDLFQSGQISKETFKFNTVNEPAVPLPKNTWEIDPSTKNIENLYLNTATNREIPALLWGQRRLIPSSAIERALYIIKNMNTLSGNIVFLGDDDLVSPIIAAIAPNWKVQVVDIDNDVLKKAEKVAGELGANLSVSHNDLSQATSEFAQSCDLVVCDPFPSGDGSFELMFWYHAASVLQPGGILITTAFPSHKPITYSTQALHQLQKLGFSLFDLQADFGIYEVFDFEFVLYEKQVLNNLSLSSSVSQTKSILAAMYFPEASSVDYSRVEFDFQKWTHAAEKHYLTLQAGVNKQKQIASERWGSPTRSESKSNVSNQKEGLDILVVLPPKQRKVKFKNHRGAESIIDHLPKVLFEEYGIVVKDDELLELRRLSTTSKLTPSGQLAKLGLAIRAIESWERWRFDD